MATFTAPGLNAKRTYTQLQEPGIGRITFEALKFANFQNISFKAEYWMQYARTTKLARTKSFSQANQQAQSVLALLK
ncbi:MAG: hypothetical protein CM15mP51_05560 [Porticoccaceae bacterium]|nr:MAG: hypothetical protein CM15mP51_05560 [Porticoccaceae bacterium]